MDIEYRKIKKNDFECLKDLLKENFDIIIKDIINNDNQYSLVAVINNKVVGHILFTKIYNPFLNIYWGKIDYVCVDDYYRNNKIATNLLQRLEQMENNINYFELTSNKKRTIAHKLYMKSGYKIIDTNLFRKEKILK